MRAGYASRQRQAHSILLKTRARVSFLARFPSAPAPFSRKLGASGAKV